MRNKDENRAGTLMESENGGLCVRYKNGTGSPSVKGECVTVSDPWTVDKVTVGVPNCIGVFEEEGVPAGELAWVVVSGIALVSFSTSVVAGYLARTPIAAEGGVSGKAISEAVPTSPFASDKHFCEIGHCIETGPAGLYAVNLHFN